MKQRNTKPADTRAADKTDGSRRKPSTVKINNGISGRESWKKGKGGAAGGATGSY